MHTTVSQLRDLAAHLALAKGPEHFFAPAIRAAADALDSNRRDESACDQSSALVFDSYFRWMRSKGRMREAHLMAVTAARLRYGPRFRAAAGGARADRVGPCEGLKTGGRASLQEAG